MENHFVDLTMVEERPIKLWQRQNWLVKFNEDVKSLLELFFVEKDENFFE